MDEEEYVEASDSEELEVLRAVRGVRFSTPTPQSAANLETPRKRRKLHHAVYSHDAMSEGSLPPFEAFDSRSEVTGSSTPIALSVGPPTSTAISPEESKLLTVSQKLGLSDEGDTWEDDSESYFQEIRQEEPSEPVTLEDIIPVATEHDSQDELDVISQPLIRPIRDSPKDGGLMRRGSQSPSPLRTSPSAHLLEERNSKHPSPRRRTSASPDRVGPLGPGHGPFSLFSSPGAFSSQNAGNHSSPLSSLAPSPRLPRHSSLPPSSPVRASSTLSHTPQRASSLSPVRIPPIRAQSHGEKEGYPPNNDDLGISDMQEDGSPRRYSLRNRQPRQLNPYAYDKRLYKLQMRHNPDAIVKVVSPPRQHARHNHDPQGETDFIAPEERDEESQVQMDRRRGGRKSHDTSNDVQDRGDESPKWLPKAFELSDDELPPLPSFRPGKASSPTSLNTTENSRARSRKVRRFPLLESRVRAEKGPLHVKESTDRPSASSGITYIRRKVTQRSPADHGAGSGAEGIENELARSDLRSPARALVRARNTSVDPVDRHGHLNLQVDGQLDDTFDSIFDQDFRDDFNDDIGMGHDPTTTDDMLNNAPVSLRRLTKRTSPLRPSQSESEDGESDSQALSGEELNLRNKEWKILNHMMPRVMLSRILGTQAPKTTAKETSCARSNSNPPHNSADEDERTLRLVPGRSRIKKRLGIQSDDRQILGDTESSDSEIEETTNNNRDSADGGPDSRKLSEDSSSSSDSDDLEDVEVLGEQSGYFDHDFSRYYQNSESSYGRREDLIDRMLTRARTGNKSSKSKRNPKRRSTATHPAKADNGDLGRPKNPALDVVIPRPHPNSQHRTQHGNVRSGRQMRLPFSPVAVADNRRPSDDVVDLTEIDPAPCLPELKDGVIQLESYEQPKKLSKKQKREAALRGTLFTVPGRGKTVTNGRRKGYLQIQIDMADDGFLEALAPLRSAKPKALHSKRALPKPGPRAKPKSYESNSESEREQPVLKQTSLHDFPHFEADDFNHAGDPYDVARPAVPSTTSTWPDGGDVTARFAFCSVDMDINPFPLGLAFGQSTYIGKQLLHDLLAFVSGSTDFGRPLQYTGFGLVDLDADMAPSCFSDSLEVTCNLLCEWLDEEFTRSVGEDDARRYELLMYSVCRFAVWVYSQADEEGRSKVQTSALYCSRQLIEKARSHINRPQVRTGDLGPRLFCALWFSVELTTRISISASRFGLETDTVHWKESILFLVQILTAYGLKRTLEPIEKGEMNEYSPTLRAAELWICLIHLLPCVSSSKAPAGFGSDHQDTLWSFILEAQKGKHQPISDVEISEQLWRLLFSLSALSQFSVHGNSTAITRLSANWDFVAMVLDSIRLTHEQDKDKNRPYESLKKRDKYVRIVVARCYLLSTRWRWALRDAYVMFKKLVVIFKSRMFANLIGEESDFPAFLRHADLGLLNTIRGSDSAFSLFLKLVVLAARADGDAQETAQRAQSRLTKLLSLTVPLSGVPFSETQPPIGEELSMLYNRYSSIIVAIYVDPSEANVRERLDRARRYINFAEADARSRRVCIRALMYTAILVQHLSLPLTEPLKWLGEISDTLLREFQTANAGTELTSKHSALQQTRRIGQDKNRTILAIQLLLGSVRKILETPHMKSEELDASLRYPDVGLLSGPWVKRIFSLKELTNVATTRFEIMLLVRSFLNVRSKIIPPPRRPALSPLDSTESQELYDEFGFDDDVLAALDLGDGVAANDANKEKDEAVAEIMNVDIVPAILRLVLQYFNDPTASLSHEERQEEYWKNADDWIDCWVGCAAIVVRNGKRNWDHYLNVGPQSWGGISDSFFRRRVALRFMYRLLHCDPTAYKDRENTFLAVLLESLVAFRITMENEYISLLFSIDGLRHTMLRAIPVCRESEMEDFHLSRTQFTEKRFGILEGMISNLNASLERASLGGVKELMFTNQSFVECLVLMLSAMQDIWKSLFSPEDRDSYSDLCRRVFVTIRRYPRVQDIPRLATYVSWGTSFETPLLD
ncbi:hypothetical protein M0805_001083 [Coniferiporia weirii]|nr:hypothetical protein M0805_001083 [Coniferiporia weirii]